MCRTGYQDSVSIRHRFLINKYPTRLMKFLENQQLQHHHNSWEKFAQLPPHNQKILISNYSRRSEEHYSEAKTHLSPKAKNLYKIASHLSRANRRLGYTRRLIRSTREVLNEALQRLDSTVATFIKSQITLAGSKSQGCRYSLEDKLMGLILHKQSGRGCRALSKIFALPSKKTVMQLLNRIPINPGVNDVFFKEGNTCIQESH
ncbi:unnamed protein product [Acanthoscelides obtectus]|uniref:Uncharacterized protein n=1 Tax=Acanthoscelides obtectus TaxID=200917 RepID=A0A9P0M305_ACAOB|nr:unnamed protein product [Acanthoscelides obtectus]CAK1624178.1 hypothetical protein AOBTE_LOCUS2378 [Acanthoscelides obtectus]